MELYGTIWKLTRASDRAQPRNKVNCRGAGGQSKPSAGRTGAAERKGRLPCPFRFIGSLCD